MKRKLLALTLTTSLLLGCIGHFSYSQAEGTEGSWQVKTSTELGFDSIYSIKKDTIIGQKDGKTAVWDSGKGQVVTMCFCCGNKPAALRFPYLFQFSDSVLLPIFYKNQFYKTFGVASAEQDF